MFKVSVPGSLMLFGEHAVLYGKTAIVAAIDARLHIEIAFNNLEKINIYSSIGTINLNIHDLNNINTNIINWEFVLSSIKSFNIKYSIKKGFDLIITNSNLKISSGFGSSAAVVVGVLASLNLCFAIKQSNQELFVQALDIVHEVQNGLGSGADVAASIYGGIVSVKNYAVQKLLTANFDLTAVYCGYKTKTADVINIINQKINQYPELYNYIFDSYNTCSKLALLAIQNQDLYTLGKLMDIAHGLMSGMGVVDNILDQLAVSLRAQNNIYGAKVSGAGLGDCVIGLGKLASNNLFKEGSIFIQIDQQGLIY